MSVASITSLLRTRAGIEQNEFSDTALESFVNHAISRISSDTEVTDVTSGSAEEALAMLYAMADIAYARAATGSLKYRISSERGEVYQNQIAENNLRLAEQLRGEIKDLRSKIDGDETVFVGELIRINRFGQQVPLTLQDVPTAVTLTAVVDDSSVELTWTESTVSDFSHYNVWRDTTSDMVDPMTYTADSADNLGFVSTSELIKTVGTRWKTYWEDLDLDAGTYYYVVEVVDNSGERALSSVTSATVS